MCIANLVFGLEHLLYLKNEPMELTDFLHFACWYNFMQIKRWLEIAWVGMVKSEYG